MTDNEIIKALECIGGKALSCRYCPYSKRYPMSRCREQCAKDALDLINRQRAEVEQYMDYNDKLIESFDEQKAEIERLEIELKAMRGTANSLKMHYDLAVAEREANVKGFTESIATAKAEAVKEFAEEVKMGFCPECEYATYNIREYIDALVKKW